MKSLIVRRSIIIDGHKTQISLEKAVWTDLKKIARGQGATVRRLVSEIDDTRKQGSLSSAIRLYVLEYFRTLGKNDP